ncbi:glycerophosphodiester phosphodiesterase [Leuconostoc gelidum subsp. gelidum]|uniref:Glycerophosphodiester phosphodiesterase n=1 Tax=Leuconostoc gelidum subsp. gelidum TaxID=1607839 RepID=A0AB35FZR8_LEUGE|nr:glycerophosphodiester phosphodiesterase [Leuconostoc gelidum]MBZ5964940.1 glycerophosphodiester phosphodiesterase [Leuconostoc gelidum subsp. gelidum]MBZ5974495.1 glycerophosphodiester phosphodiesterase [Leuconostoc gelidum subsp. gelidum]MBZ5977333.1 glycerophosphodiester phosphodiesterase [Leuconostoc gelidum subsp. gelidum]MBZ5998986.1 glycerophosphodiester phosphodiesterase [Leuconostoc gelidum subsp. gelidum]MBZ6015900.1 glycerophosphodiester phosphodiesterase [Leuconostoc gelidum subs
MQYIRLKIKDSVEFLWHSKSYLKSVVAIHALFIFILLPILGESSQFILKISQINYLSLNNLGTMMRQQPLVFLALISIFILSILLSFFEFAFLLISVYFIQTRQPVSVRQLLVITLRQLRKVGISTGLFFLFYLVLILPLGGVSYSSNLLSKVKIPAFLMDYIFDHRFIVVGAFILVYILLTYIGVRLIFVLPNLILNDLSIGEAIKSSLTITRRKFVTILLRLAVIGFGMLLFSSVSIAGLIGIQKLVEQYSHSYTVVSAAVIMTLLQIIILINIAITTVGMFLVIIDFMSKNNVLSAIKKPDSLFSSVYHKNFANRLSAPLYIVLGIMSAVIVGGYNFNYLKSVDISKPISVSHRGVSEKNGVQNSISAMNRTAQYHPDYVEMDVQLTKDNQFVVFHDFNLKQLTGVNNTPKNMNLSALTKLKVHENNQVQPIESFDDYLKSAKAIHQKLLIELKTPNKDNTQLVERFMQKYQKDIQENDYMIQSLNFELIEDIKKIAPTVKAGYILPFNLIGPPISHSDFYTVEFSTVNKHFIQTAHNERKKVFVWTPNDKKSILRMMYFGADGVITDNMPAVGRAMTDANHITYSDKLLYYVAGLG